MSPRIFFYFSCLQNFMPDHMRQRMTFFYFKICPKNLRDEALYFSHKMAILANFELPKNPYLPTLGNF